MDFAATFDSLPWASWILAAGAVLVFGIGKSGFGGGVGILAVPMFVLAMGPKVGLGAMLPLLVVADCFSVYHHWGKWDRSNLRVLLPGTLGGLGLGTLLLAWILRLNGSGPDSLAGAERPMQITIGSVCILYFLADLVRQRYAPYWRWQATWVTGTIAGGLAGVTSTVAHAAGPVAAIFFLGQHLAKKPFIGTTVAYFWMLNAMKLAPYIWLDMIDPATLRYGILLLPLVPLGTWIGAWLNRIMNESLYRNTIMLLVFLTGLKMVFSN